MDDADKARLLLITLDGDKIARGARRKTLWSASEQFVAKHWAEISAVAKELHTFGMIEGDHAELVRLASVGTPGAASVLADLRVMVRSD